MNKPMSSALVLAFALIAPSLAFAATNDHAAARSGSSVAGMTEAQAVAEIQTDGYTHIQKVRATKSGWTAKALEGGKPVSLIVDNAIGVRKQ